VWYVVLGKTRLMRVPEQPDDAQLKFEDHAPPAVELAVTSSEMVCLVPSILCSEL
jgi:hypothetical protein